MNKLKLDTCSENGSTMDSVLKDISKIKIRPAAQDAFKTLLLVIDLQQDFMDDGSLPVPGAYRDADHLAAFITGNMENITTIAASLDTHVPLQIFHPCWWTDREGRQPAPYTVIRYEDVQNGVYHPVTSKKESVNYLYHLERTGKELTIWPYHCIDGTRGCCLNDRFSAALNMHSTLRSYTPLLMNKGNDPLSEMYGIISPEYNRSNRIDTRMLNLIAACDKVLIAGEAKSHCVLRSLQQITSYFANTPRHNAKLTLLSDCSSPIPGFELVTENAIDELVEKYGISVSESTGL